MEAKSKQMPLQTSRHATKAMAQQVPIGSSDILLECLRAGATFKRSETRKAWTVSRADGAGPLFVM